MMKSKNMSWARNRTCRIVRRWCSVEWYCE